MSDRKFAALFAALLIGAGSASAHTGMTAATSGSGTAMPSAAELRAVALKAKAAFERGYKENGIGGEMQVIRACYAGLRPASPATRRVYCLYLDLAAFRFEQAQPDQFRQMDERLDDYLTGQKFGLRAEANILPLNGDPAVKAANYKMLKAAYDAD